MSVTVPSEFVSNHDIKAFTHGFSSRIISDDETLFVDGICNFPLEKCNDDDLLQLG